jgi:hypothetical protein
MDISPKLNGANIKQLKEQDNNNNISTLRNIRVNKDKKKTQCFRHQSKCNTTQITTRRTMMSEE